MVFLGHEAELRDLFAGLLATSMDAETASLAHPAFVEIIKQLAPDEARILRYMSQHNMVPMIDIEHEAANPALGFSFPYTYITTLGEDARCEAPDLVPIYISNLLRLELCDAPEDGILAMPGSYDRLENSGLVDRLIKRIEQPERDPKILRVEPGIVRKHKRLLELTPFGRQFLKACIR